MLRLPGYAQTAPVSNKCPDYTSISPCYCRNTFIYLEGIDVVCRSRGLNDSQISRILDAFLVPGLSPVYEIDMTSNQLTKVPNQISKFPILRKLQLTDNKITEIPYEGGKPFLSNNVTNNLLVIDLSWNQITRIPPGLFEFPSASTVYIYLSQNKISSISLNAFKMPNTEYIFCDLSSNLISDFPNGTIFDLPKASVVTIYFNNNQMKKIPSVATFNFPLAKTIRMYFHWNNITSIPCPSTLFAFPLAVKVEIRLDNNQITTIPSCAFNFPSANSVVLQLQKNFITTISLGAFNFPVATEIYLMLQNNQISVIPSFSFSKGNKIFLIDIMKIFKNQLLATITCTCLLHIFTGKYFWILLANNKLKRLESAVFKTPLLKMATKSAMNVLDLSSSNFS